MSFQWKLHQLPRIFDGSWNCIMKSIFLYFLLIKSTLESEIIYVFELFVIPMNTLLKCTHTWYQGQNSSSGEIISPFCIINHCTVKFCWNSEGSLFHVATVSSLTSDLCHTCPFITVSCTDVLELCNSQVQQTVTWSKEVSALICLLYWTQVWNTTWPNYIESSD